MNVVKWIVAGALVIPVSVTSAYADQKNSENRIEHKITMAQLPAAVKLTVQRESRGKTLEWMESVEKNGKTVYEMELVSNGKGQVIEVSDAGKVIDRRAPHDETNEASEGEK